MQELLLLHELLQELLHELPQELLQHDEPADNDPEGINVLLIHFWQYTNVMKLAISVMNDASNALSVKSLITRSSTAPEHDGVVVDTTATPNDPELVDKPVKVKLLAPFAS